MLLLDMREHGLSYHETVRKYWGNNANENNFMNQVKLWEHIYLTEGEENGMSPVQYRTHSHTIQLFICPLWGGP